LEGNEGVASMVAFTGPAQREFLRRLDIRDEDLALAAQTLPIGAIGYIRSRVAARGSMTVYGRGEKGVVRYGEAFEAAFGVPLEVKRKRVKL